MEEGHQRTKTDQSRHRSEEWCRSTSFLRWRTTGRICSGCRQPGMHARRREHSPLPPIRRTTPPLMFPERQSGPPKHVRKASCPTAVPSEEFPFFRATYKSSDGLKIEMWFALHLRCGARIQSVLVINRHRLKAKKKKRRQISSWCFFCGSYKTHSASLRMSSWTCRD